MLSPLSTQASMVLKKLFDVSDVEVTWQRPADASHGDATTSVALRLAKDLGKKPREIAEALAKELGELTDVEKVEVAGAGYVNVWFSPAYLLKSLEQTRKACVPAVKRKEAPVIIDYAGPNIAKPLGIHHILSHVVGQAIINLWKHTGHNVIGWSYLGDWGTQFGKLAVAFEKWGEGKKAKDCTVEELLALYVKFHQEAEKDATLEDEARALFAKIEAGDKKLLAFWKEVVDVTHKELTKLYARLQINIDIETGESFYQDKMDPVFTEAERRGIVEEGKEGASIVPFPEEMNLPPLMLRKKDGSTLYATRDLAMVRYRIDTYHPQAMYYVVDVAQSLHFQQVFAACKLLGWKMPEHEHVAFGRMRFTDGSMSTRKGTVLRLEEVLDEGVRRAASVIKERGDAIQTDDPKELADMMGIGALVYGVLSQNRKMDIVFDWDKFLNFEGNSAPYLQYTHARAKSVLRKAESEGELNIAQGVTLEQHDRVLIRTLLQFGDVIEEARAEHLPHKLAHYLYGLCQDFNAFYNSSPILKSEEGQKNLRLALTQLTATVLKAGAEILTLRVPDRM